jgi:hypothetical protein
VPAGDGREHNFLPVMGGGRGHKIYLAGAGSKTLYPRVLCLLPSIKENQPATLKHLDLLLQHPHETLATSF